MSNGSNEFTHVESGNDDTITDDENTSTYSPFCLNEKLIKVHIAAIRRHLPGYNKSYQITTPEQVLDKFYDKLNEYERREIKQYPDIYYFGEKALFKISNYETSEGFYQYVLFDHLGYRYEIWDTIGRTGFSTVLKAYDHKERIFVAIKIIRNRRFHFYDTENEVNILQYIKNHSKDDEDFQRYFVQMYDTFYFRRFLCIVFELMSTDLYELMRPIKNKGCSLKTVQHIGSVLISSVYTLHKHKIAHCDLKPENLMIKNQDHLVKLTDFGLSCFFDDLNSGTAKQTLHFCAPETLILGPITPAIDMWSIACILAELYTGETLLKGEDNFDQMSVIIELLGTPPKQVLLKCKATQEFLYENGVPKYCYCVEDGFGGFKIIPKITNQGTERGLPGSRKLKDALKGCEDETLIDLIDKCLDWNPHTRITAESAMRHSFMKKSISHSPITTSFKFPIFTTPVPTRDTLSTAPYIVETNVKYNNRSTVSGPF